MTEEPVYIYIKGQGWVLTNTPTLVFEAHGYRVTLQERRPQPGEWCFIERSDVGLTEIMEALKQSFNAYRFQPDNEIGLQYRAGRTHHDNLIDKHKGSFCVVYAEPLNHQ